MGAFKGEIPLTVIRQPWLRAALLLAIWTAIALSFAAQLYISGSRLGIRVSWWYAVNHALCDWYVFAVLSVPAAWLARRCPIDRVTWPTYVPLHLVASAGFSLAFILIRTWVAQAQGWFISQPVQFVQAFEP